MGIMENMLGCCSNKGEIMSDQEDQGKLSGEDSWQKKAFRGGKRAERVPKGERDYEHSSQREERGDEVEVAISWIGYATVTNNPKYLRDVSLLPQRAVSCSPTFLFYHQPAAALLPTSISGPKLSCGRGRRQSRPCYGIPSSHLHRGHWLHWPKPVRWPSLPPMGQKGWSSLEGRAYNFAIMRSVTWEEFFVVAAVVWGLGKRLRPRVKLFSRAVSEWWGGWWDKMLGSCGRGVGQSREACGVAKLDWTWVAMRKMTWKTWWGALISNLN